MDAWDQFQDADAGVATLSGDDPWSQFRDAQPLAANPIEDSGTYGTLSVPIRMASAAMNWGAGPKPWDFEDNASELEQLNAKRLKELYQGFEPLEIDENAPLIQRQLAERENTVRAERSAETAAEMKRLGMSPEEYLQKERYDNSQDPVSRLIDAPVFRGVTTGVGNAASIIGESALRLLPGEGGPSKLADKIGRSRVAEDEYQSFLDKRQGKAAQYPTQAASMIAEFAPVAALTGGQGVAPYAAARGAADAYLKSDSDAYAATSAVIQGALTYIGGKVGGGTIQEMLGGQVKAKAASGLLRSYGAELGEEFGQLYGQALADRRFGVGSGKMPTGEDLMDTLAVVTLAQSAGSAMSASVGDDPALSMMPEAVKTRAGAMGAKAKAFVDKAWPSRNDAKSAGVEQIATTAKKRHDLAAKVRDALTATKFKEQLKATATSPEEADALYKLVEARAESAGESLDAYVGRRIKGVEKTRKADVELTSGVTRPQGRRGEIEFVEDGRAIIRAFEAQNISTLAHEVGHLFRRDLAGNARAYAETWAGAKDGKWNKTAEEKFARGFERYLRTGRAPTTNLKAVFEKFKGWLANVYKAVRGTPLDVNFNKEMRQVYDSLFIPSEGTQTSPNIEQDKTVAPNQPAEGQSTDQTSPNQTLSQDLADRFRGLSNRATDLEARAANYNVDEEMGFPSTRGRDVAQAEAARRLSSDPNAEVQQFLGKISEADASQGTIHLSESDAVTLDAIIEGLGKDIATPESRQLHRTLLRARRQSMTEAARTLGIRDPLGISDPRTSAITEAIATPTPEETDARKAARTPEEHAEVDRQMEDRYNRAKDELAKLGIDLDDIAGNAADPKKSMLVLDAFRKDASWPDVLFEYWRNAILSGPRTQVTNAVGNTLFAAWHLGPERAAEAAVNLFARDPKGAQLGEFKHLLGGILPGIRRGLRNAAKSWKLETSALAEELGREGAFKVEGARGAIKGRAGRLIRMMGYRPLLAADELAKSITATMEAGAHAYRAGKAQGLEGAELQQFVAEQVDDLSSSAWDQGLAKAEELAFQGKRGAVAQGLISGGNKLRRIRGVRWMVPFVDTPASIIEQGLKRAPVLGAILDYVESRRGGSDLVDAGMTPTLARQIIGLSGAALIWAAVDDEDPWITGAAVLADKKNRDASYRTMPPMSVKIGGKAYSYQRIEPFATSLAWTVDFIHGLKKGKPLSASAFSTAQQLKNKSYLDGLGDVMEMVEGLGSGESAPIEEWAGKFAASWVPNMWRQTVGSLSGEIPESRVWGKEDEHSLRVLRRAVQSAQVPGVDTQPRYDIWGRRIRYNDSWGNAATDFAWSLLSPVKVKDLSAVQQADLALVRYNAQNPDDQRVWSEPQKFVKDRGETHYLSDEQYAQYAETAGKMAQAFASRVHINEEKPRKAQVESVGRAISRARAAARKSLLPTWRMEWAATSAAATPTPASD